MKSRVAVFALACLLSFGWRVEAGDCIGCSKIPAALGLRYDRPVQNLRIGDKVTATILNASKLAPHGVTARNNDKVDLTLTGRNTFSLFHAGSGRTLKFSYDTQGNLTPAR